MKSYYDRPDGYIESIQKGTAGVGRFHGGVYYGSGDREAEIAKLRKELETAEAIIIGAGAGMSTSAGFTYSGERFEKYFSDFAARFGIEDMYSGGFYPFPDAETRWAWWARHIYYNRYIDAPKPVYKDLYELVKDKDYFVITTNVDHQFQRAGFDKTRLFYTQGDYGLFQTVDGRNGMTYDNEEWVMKAMEAQGFVRDENGVFQIPEDGRVSMRIPSDLIPKTPDGKDVTNNLRADMTFVRESFVDWSSGTAQMKNREHVILIPASSVKGALSHRLAFHYNKIKEVFADKIAEGEKIENFVGKNNEAVKAVFGSEGDKDDDGKVQNKKRGNVLISDIIQQANVSPKILNHVSIDRFTGGAIDGALFNEETLYAKGQLFELKLLVNNSIFKGKDEVKTAFEDTLKDLCSGMLPLGGGINRGNGCFEGTIKITEN